MPGASSGGASNISTSQIVDETIVNADISPSAAITPDKIAGEPYEQLITATLGAGATTLSSGTFAARKHLRVVIYCAGSASALLRLLVNGDTGANYDGTRSSLSAAATQYAGNTSWALESLAGTVARYVVVDIYNVATKNKFMHSVLNHDNDVSQCTGEWLNSTDAITSLTLILDAAGDLTAGTEITVFGHN